MERERVVIYDRRKREKWEGTWEKLHSRFPELPSLREMTEVWKGKGVVARDRRGIPEIFVLRGWTVQLIKVKRGAGSSATPDYKKVRLRGICSRFAHQQR